MRFDVCLARQARVLFVFLLAGVLLCWNVPTRVQAEGGELDVAFGDGGKLTADNGRNEAAYAIVLQPDGKIVVAGTMESKKKGFDFAIARLYGNGSFDEAFGDEGSTSVDFFGSNDSAYAVAIQSDGKIVAAGEAYNTATRDSDFAIARFNTDGSLDPSFGKVATDFFGLADCIFAMAMQSDGKIVAAGMTNSTASGGFDFALARYNPNGSLDSSFGSGGKVTTDFFNGSDICYAIAIQPDQKIVAAGYMSDNFALARYNSDGSLDTTFGTEGETNIDFWGAQDYAFAIALQPDGKILAAGYAESFFSGIDFALARLNYDGLLDDSFGSLGRITTDFFGDNDAVLGLAIQPDDKILAAGFATASAGKDFALVRYNTDGGLDTTFGSAGQVNTDLMGGDDLGFGLALTPKGRAMVTGYTIGEENQDFAIACYRAYTVVPQITGAEVSGKKLYVYGKNFDSGAEVWMNGEMQKKTRNDDLSPTTMLIAKKTGKKIAPGETVTLQVRNSDGALSEEFTFMRP
jgi:uncharacterized delta-60 repeat protein